MWSTERFVESKNKTTTTTTTTTTNIQNTTQFKQPYLATVIAVGVVDKQTEGLPVGCGDQIVKVVRFVQQGLRGADNVVGVALEAGGCCR